MSDKPKTPFTETDLHTAWENYAGAIKNDGKASFAATLVTHKPKIGENFALIVEVENKVQETEMNLNKIEIVSFLRETLNNFSIVLSIKVTEQAAGIQFYTNSERFKRLAEINPLLWELKNKFNGEV